MACSNCYNGCAEIQSDKCVRYTGIDISALEISNGDTLLSVEQKIITYLISALDGTGITPDVDTLCNLVADNLNGTSLVDILTALIAAICNLDTRVTANTGDLTTLNGDYDVDCLAAVTDSSDTHAVVQAIIVKLCALNLSFTQLVANLPTDYVAISDLNDLIQEYLDSINSGTLISDKMIPYVVYPYFADPGANFSGDGTGLGNWAKIYLCNGLHSTPDLRGRVVVGVTDMGGVTTDVPVAPGGANPTYELNDTEGSNSVTLSTGQLPSHTHANTATATQVAHSHFTVKDGVNDVELTNGNYIKVDSVTGADYTLRGTSSAADIGLTSDATPAITVTMTNASIGSSEAHSNIQPVRALNYIIFIP